MSMYVVRRDLAGDDDETGRHERLARDAAVRILGEDRVEDRVRHLVGDLVRVTLRHRFGGEREAPSGHSQAPRLVRKLVSASVQAFVSQGSAARQGAEGRRQWRLDSARPGFARLRLTARNG